jgi:hypothetical protein
LLGRIRMLEPDVLLAWVAADGVVAVLGIVVCWWIVGRSARARPGGLWITFGAVWLGLVYVIGAIPVLIFGLGAVDALYSGDASSLWYLVRFLLAVTSPAISVFIFVRMCARGGPR